MPEGVSTKWHTLVPHLNIYILDNSSSISIKVIGSDKLPAIGHGHKPYSTVFT